MTSMRLISLKTSLFENGGEQWSQTARTWSRTLLSFLILRVPFQHQSGVCITGTFQVCFISSPLFSQSKDQEKPAAEP